MAVKHLRSDSIQITDYVIALIAAEVIKELPFIKAEVGKLGKEVLSIVNKKYIAKGVSVSSHSTYVEIQIRISIQYGESIVKSSYYLQKNVKKQVEQITGLCVKAVDIFVEKVFL